MTISRLVRAFACLCLVALAACGGRGEIKRINPPLASVQQLAAQADGRWQVELRLHNQSTVAMHFATIELQLVVEGEGAGSVFVHPELDIPGQYADVVSATLTPSASARTALANASGSGSIGYALTGTVTTTDPDKRFDIDTTSRLSPVPGRPDTYR
jgi:hypothetical protein